MYHIFGLTYLVATKVQHHIQEIISLTFVTSSVYYMRRSELDTCSLHLFLTIQYKVIFFPLKIYSTQGLIEPYYAGHSYLVLNFMTGYNITIYCKNLYF